MSRKFYSFIFVFLFFLKVSPGTAQVNDAGLWTSVNVTKKIIPKLTAALTEELRFNENISELGTAFTEMGADYKFNKFISFGVSYRFIQKRKVDDFYSMRHRCNMDLSLKFKIKKTAITVRERFQTQYADVTASENGKVPERYLRSKITLKHDIEKKYTPFISTEFFYQLSNPAGNELDNVRYAIGFDYDITKRMSVELFYLINKEFNVNDPLTEYISGTGFTYSF